MHSLSTAQQKLKAVLEACGLPVALRQEWDTEYLAVPIVVDPEQNRQLSARFALIEDGQPALTDLPGDGISASAFRIFTVGGMI